MAGEFRLGTEAVQEVIEILKDARAGGKLEDVANKAGFDVEVINDIVEKGVKNVKGGKGILSALVEKLGGAVEGVQTEVNTILGRRKAIPEGTVPPSAKGAVDITGPVDGARGKGFTMQAEPRGGPLARTAEILENQTVDPVTGAPMSSQTALTTIPGYGPTREPLISQEEISKSAAAGQARVQAEGDARTRRMEADANGPGGFQAAQEELSALGETGIPLDLTLPGGLKVGVGVVAGAGALGGLTVAYKNYVQKPEAQQQIPSAVAAEIKNPQDVTGIVDKAVPAMEPEKAQQLQAQAKEVLTIAQQLERTLQTSQAQLRKDEKAEKDRLALFRLFDKIADGVATAMGSYALLQRGSPFAVDFSKGPKIDWDARYNSIQKEYQGLRDELINKYKIDMRAEERAQERELEREKFDTQKKEKEAADDAKAEAKLTADAKQAEAKREATFNKLQGSLAIALDETTKPGRLLTEKKNLVTMGSSLIGAKTTDALLQTALDEAKANRGWSITIKEFLGMDVQMKPEEQAKVTRRFAELLNTKLEEAPQAPQAPQAEKAPEDPAERLKFRRAQKKLKEAAKKTGQ